MVTQTKSIYGRAFGYGILGAFIMTVLMALMRWVGMTTFNLPMFLGSMLTQEFNASTWVVGFIWHLINGGIFGLVYAAVFKGVGKASAGKGTLLGFVHWLVFSAAAAFSPGIHPLIPSEIVAPGFFVINYGVFTAVGGLALHLIYGYVVGNALEGMVARNRKIEKGYSRRYA
ncbi:MAG: hypothetical protein WD025_07190 [Bacteriovoracaceae bacterium]